MLSSNILILISWLVLIFILHDGQAVQPQGCICYNPQVLNSTDNSTVPCNGMHCSRGDNLDCFAYHDHLSSEDLPVFTIRAFGFYFQFDGEGNGDRSLLGCNCPGFKYNSTDNGMNAYSNAPPADYGYVYTYQNCKDFSMEAFDEAEYCCNYCCGSPYVPTTSVPSASGSIYSFYFRILHVLFQLIFICIKVIALDTFELKFNVYGFNPN